MKHFCTLSDKNYLALGIALYQSLKQQCEEDFKLYYLCLDDETYTRFLDYSKEETKLEPISLKELEKEKEELRTARANRPYNEYCWTLASYLTLYLFGQHKMPHLSYIDSDIYFYQDPEIIYKEIGKKHVGIIAHRHNSVGCTDGAYNVGIIYFKNEGQDVLKWWRDAVLHKRYPQYHGCGDQKYLEGFIPEFGKERICVADKTFGHGAPWNFRLYGYDKFDKGIILWGEKEQPFIFNHFSRIKYNIDTDQVEPTGGKYADHTLGFQVFNIPAINNLYRNYYVLIKEIHQKILSKKIDVPKTEIPFNEPAETQKTVSEPVEAPQIKIKKLKIAVGMILFECDYVLKQCLESIYPFASQIMIAEGPVKFFQNCGSTTSGDKTNEILDNFSDPKNKIEIIHGQFEEKDDQCKAYMPFLKKEADYIWNIDADEIFHSRDIEKIIQLLTDKRYTSVGIRPLSFYGSFDHYITGWEEKKDQFLRIFKVYPGSTWKTHRPPTIEHTAQIQLTPKHLDSETLYNEYGIRMFHYSYVFLRQVVTKIAYYKAAVSKEKCIDDYFENVYIPWVTGDEIDREIIEQAYRGVHEWKPEYRTEAMTAKYNGPHPAVIADTMDELKAEFARQMKCWDKIVEDRIKAKELFIYKKECWEKEQKNG
jgi:hypothetical protein